MAKINHSALQKQRSAGRPAAGPSIPNKLACSSPPPGPGSMGTAHEGPEEGLRVVVMRSAAPQRSPEPGVPAFLPASPCECPGAAQQGRKWELGQQKSEIRGQKCEIRGSVGPALVTLGLWPHPSTRCLCGHMTCVCVRLRVSSPPLLRTPILWEEEPVPESHLSLQRPCFQKRPHSEVLGFGFWHVSGGHSQPAVPPFG